METIASATKCPVCLDFVSAAYETACGHTFCHGCIIRHLRSNQPTCPCCGSVVSETDLRPNHTLERLVKRLRRGREGNEEGEGEGGNEEGEGEGEGEIDGDGDNSNSNSNHNSNHNGLSKVGEKHKRYQAFLQALLGSKQAELEAVQRTVDAIRSELDGADASSESSVPPTPPTPSTPPAVERELQNLYGRCVAEGRSFRRLFDGLSARHSMRTVNSVLLGDALAAGNVVSSVEYNPHRRVFAVSGSVKQIRVYDHQTFSRPLPCFGGSRLAVPLLQIATPCKVAAVCWEPCAASDLLAAADYEGSVRLYSVHAGALAGRLDEHERRVWSVDFSRTDPSVLLSGSDDGRVKQWCVRDRASTFTVDAKANVCSVQFHPDGVLFAFGAADHHIYVHDVRAPLRCLHVLEEHRKAVSYVRWLDRETLLSASTDNTIKQWRGRECVKTYRGHLHEKNFVGLAVHPRGDWFACGSETNRVHVYSRFLEGPVCDVALGGRDPLSGDPVDMEGFASSVSWAGDRELLAGNSLGMVSAVCTSKWG